jgi:hypothetical protein
VTEEQRQKIREGYEAGDSLTEIAAAAGAFEAGWEARGQARGPVAEDEGCEAWRAE